MNEDFLRELLARGANWMYGFSGNPFARVPGVVVVHLNAEERAKFGKMLYNAETLRLSEQVCSCGVGRIVKHSKSGAMRYNCTCTNNKIEDPSAWELLKPE